MNERNSQRLLFVVLVGLATLAWIFLYAVPRIQSNRSLQQKVTTIVDGRQEIALAISDYMDTKVTKAAPTPNTSSWLSARALPGLEKNVEANTPYDNGRGAQLKLRAVNAEQIATVFEALRKANLIIKSLELDDRDGDGKWNLKVMVEVPS